MKRTAEENTRLTGQVVLEQGADCVRCETEMPAGTAAWQVELWSADACDMTLYVHQGCIRRYIQWHLAPTYRDSRARYR